MSKEKVKKPKLILDFDGNVFNLKAYQENLTNSPSYCKKSIDGFGTPYLSDCVKRAPDCGCKIVGNGTLQFPLTIHFCEKHK